MGESREGTCIMVGRGGVAGGVVAWWAPARIRAPAPGEALEAVEGSRIPERRERRARSRPPLPLRPASPRMNGDEEMNGAGSVLVAGEEVGLK